MSFFLFVSFVFVVEGIIVFKINIYVYLCVYELYWWLWFDLWIVMFLGFVF